MKASSGPLKISKLKALLHSRIRAYCRRFVHVLTPQAGSQSVNEAWQKIRGDSSDVAEVEALLRKRQQEEGEGIMGGLMRDTDTGMLS